LRIRNPAAWRALHADDPDEIERRRKERTSEMLAMVGNTSPHL